jgi:hypothetical protein
MDILNFLINVTLLFNGIIIKLDTIKYPHTLMFINRVALIVLLIYLII